MQNTSQPFLVPRRAAQYVRMSTEHQQYSTENQGDKIKEYAERHGFEIVRTYADEGKSGLNIGGREGLQRMLADVRAKTTDFEAILVYDVSRWGRFCPSAGYLRQARLLGKGGCGPSGLSG